MELPITGYATTMSVAAGGEIGFAVSTTEREFDARIVKLRRKIDLFEPLKTEIDGRYPGEIQAIRPGSYACLSQGTDVWPADLSFHLAVQPSMHRHERQGLLTFGPNSGIFIDNGRIVAIAGETQLTPELEIRPNSWYLIDLTISPAQKSVHLIVREAGGAPAMASAEALKAVDAFDPLLLRLSGWIQDGVTTACFDGKIADPKIISSTLGTIACWDFSRDSARQYVGDLSGRGNELVLHQHPRRAVTGPAWDGTAHDPRLAPGHYNAIAFHSDDLTDARWPVSLSWQVPFDLPSGAYALDISCASGADHIPFFVTPAANAKRNRVAFLVPTFSYLAYANERHWWAMPDIEARTGKPLESAVSAGELWADQQKLLSCYDRHGDGTGCTHSSWLRPIVNMRAEYHHPYIMGPHQLSADLLILDWLDHIGMAFDVLTDHDLHERGVAALDGYSLVMTGSHPEYVSQAMLDALTAFNRRGGNLMYLGGNGFYCAVATYQDSAHVMELRRGHAGGLHWKSPIGEAYHAATGELGGYWRLRGRSAHVLFGVGTASVAFDRGQPFVRTLESHGDAYSWIFEGVKGDVIDTESVILGQPAGFEYDRTDSNLGTPPNTVRVASAHFEPKLTQYLAEESRWSGIMGENRADLVFIDGTDGGDVFAVGSIAWTGCLWTQGENKVATITENVIRRFSSTPPVRAADAC